MGHIGGDGQDVSLLCKNALFTSVNGINSSPNVYKSCPKCSHVLNSVFIGTVCFVKMAKKVLQYLGYFCKKIWSQIPNLVTLLDTKPNSCGFKYCMPCFSLKTFNSQIDWKFFSKVER